MLGKTEPDTYAAGSHANTHRRRQIWAALLKKIWDLDALRCPKCGGHMKVISVIEYPSVIRRILEHLVTEGAPVAVRLEKCTVSERFCKPKSRG